MKIPELLFERALQLETPWKIKEIVFDDINGSLTIKLDFPKGSTFSCPQCGKQSKAYDTKEKKWRHLNFFQYTCYLEARTPRICCETDGILQANVPWARSGSGFTLLFEALSMMLVREMPVNAASRILAEHDDRLWRIIEYYVEEARKSVDMSEVKSIGIDETSITKGHNYVTVVADLEARRTLYVTEGREGNVLGKFAQDLKEHKGNPEKITQASIDMSPAYISGVGKHIPNAKIIFDKFHIVKVINEAVDKVRRLEVKECVELKELRYAFLKNRDNLTQKQKQSIERLESMPKKNYKTIKALHIRENFQEIYLAENHEEFSKQLKKWYWWATHSRLKAMKEAAYTIKRHWDGIVSWHDNQISNGFLEGLNSLIQAAKAKARGYKTSKNFISIIYLLTGKLDFSKVGLPT